jgi:cullin-associated NEDD8-dissociated protein 1
MCCCNMLRNIPPSFLHAGAPFVNPRRDVTWTQCWDEEATITVRIGDACPCQYLIQETGEVRHQPWCCGGANHFDISFW